MRNQNLKKMVFAGLIAAVYSAVSLALAPISFGQVQLRVSEALTILPVLNPCAIWGVTIGCLITNIVGVATGANFLGAVDVFTGTLATVIAAFMTAKLGKYRWKGLPVLATLPPVLLNAVVVGGEWCYVVTGGLPFVPYLAFAGMIALGQFGACTVLGLILLRALEKSSAAHTLREI